MRTGIFGGTFNPVHYGHLRAAEEVRHGVSLDRIVFIPSGNPPLKNQELIAASHRYEMTRQAVLTNSSFDVSQIELRDQEKSFTYRTLDRLRREQPDDHLFLILGVDAFLDMPLWKNPDYIIGVVDFVVVTRPGFPLRMLSSSPYLAEPSKKGVDVLDGESGMSRSAPSEEVAVLDLGLASGRNAFVVKSTPLGISSTEIRRLIRTGHSIRYLVPECVEKYIADNGLYRQ